MKLALKKIFIVLVYAFAVIGFVLVAVYAAVELGFTKTGGIVDQQHDYFKDAIANGEAWAQGEEWTTLKDAITKDAPAIDRASAATGIPSRLIASNLIVEQLRLFHSEREVFKSVFAPLKILGNQSQFSWGVMGIKQDTAIEIEGNLASSTSPWYLGPEYAHLLDYPATTTDKDAARFARLTDEHDRYYSYLYAAVAIKEIESQWQKAGFAIQDKPEVLATLFNIGFTHSQPKAAPQSGGAAIDINGTTYSFGDLAGRFYYSDQLTDIFPR
jgi:hypothetical protein